jgi:hypothetical protein
MVRAYCPNKHTVRLCVSVLDLISSKSLGQTLGPIIDGLGE